MIPSLNLFHRRIEVHLSYHDDMVTLLVRKGREMPRIMVRNIDPGIIEGGEIVDQRTIVSCVREMLKEIDPRPGAFDDVPANVVIPESSSFTQLLTFGADIPRAQVPKLAEERAKNLVPLPFDDSYSDCVLTDPGSSGPSSALISIVPKIAINSHIAVILGAGLSPGTAETEMCSLARALIKDTKKVTAILDIGRRTTNVGVFDDTSRMPKISVTIPIAGDTFTHALMERLKIGRDEAERLKREEGFDVNKGAGWTIVILQERVQAILRELEKAFKYYETNFGKKIERVILTGGSALIPSIDLYFKVNLSREIVVGDPSENLLGVRINTAAHPLRLAAMIGISERADSSGRGRATPDLFSGWRKEHSLANQVVTSQTWRYAAVGVSVSSICVSGYLLYVSLYLPFAMYRDEAASRTYPSVPYLAFTEISDSAPTTTETVPSLVDSSASSTEDSEVPSLDLPTVEKESGISEAATPIIVIGETPTGWLNVRSGPGSQFDILRKVVPGDTFEMREESGEWVSIDLSDGKTGWVSKQYVRIRTTE